jgi:hypothetical protein
VQSEVVDATVVAEHRLDLRSTSFTVSGSRGSVSRMRSSTIETR